MSFLRHQKVPHLIQIESKGIPYTPGLLPGVPYSLIGGSLSMNDFSNGLPQKRGVLSGWKAIADYLGCGVRTVQRYEAELHLPVRRPAGKIRAAVIATRDDLDTWISLRPMRPVKPLVAQKRVFEGFDSLQARMDGMKESCRKLEQSRSELRAAVQNLRNTIQIAHLGRN